MKTIKKDKPIRGDINIFEIVTNQIIEQLNNKIVPWKKPWKTQTLWPCNLISKKPYHGINIFLLISKDYSRPYWLTYNQAKENGGHVKKGEKSTKVIYWKILTVEKTEEEIEREKEREEGEVEKFKEIPIIRYYRVFNVAQTEGLEQLIPEEKTKQINFNPIKECEKIVLNYEDIPPIKN
ncbi:MAG: ArdC family protein, partial [Candidatus Zambryskibacteria bacterium]|nr:ArdC family protein [Candidatus Zambryskibacteria bacterium]